jgi:hypothetical protein
MMTRRERIGRPPTIPASCGAPAEQLVNVGTESTIRYIEGEKGENVRRLGGICTPISYDESWNLWIYLRICNVLPVRLATFGVA